MSLIKREEGQMQTGSTGLIQVKGPLGLWPWPIFNFILALIASLRTRISIEPHRYDYTRRRISVWSLERDEKGRITGIVEREIYE